MAPFADVNYFADEKWFRWHTAGIAKPALGLTAAEVRERFASFAGQKATIEPTGMQVDDPAVHMLRNGGKDGLSLDSAAICNGRNSGHQAINVAALAGAARIVLLGFDGRVGEDGRTHCHGGHPDKTHGATFCVNFRTLTEPLKDLGVEIINASPGSVIDAFPRRALDQVLQPSGSPQQ